VAVFKRWCWYEVEPWLEEAMDNPVSSSSGRRTASDGRVLGAGVLSKSPVSILKMLRATTKLQEDLCF
jgi:hypothetical protein